jgi:hypothetical protein
MIMLAAKVESWSLNSPDIPERDDEEGAGPDVALEEPESEPQAARVAARPMAAAAANAFQGRSTDEISFSVVRVQVV